MQFDNRLIDDFARVASGAVSALAGVRSEVEGVLRQQLERLLRDLDLVTRDEFDAVKAMAATARSEQEDLAEKLAALEEKVAALKG